MKIKIQKFTKILLITSLIIGYSCSNINNQINPEDNELTLEEQQSSREFTSDEQQALDDCNNILNDPNFDGTVCCTLGPLTVSPGELLIYYHTNNYSPSSFSWEVLSGSITIMSDANSAEVKLKFGDDFAGGQIVARSVGIEAQEIQCSEAITITKK